jgi:hypothetical protein
VLTTVVDLGPIVRRVMWSGGARDPTYARSIDVMLPDLTNDGTMTTIHVIGQWRCA